MSKLGAGWSLRRGQQALFCGDLDGARKHLEAAIESRPKWAAPRLWFATMLSDSDALDEARAELEAAMKLTDGATVVSLWLGRVLIDHEKFEEARDVLETALEKSHGNLYVPGYLALARWGEAGDDAPLDDLKWELPPGGSELQGRWLLEIETRFPGGPGVELLVDPEPPRRPWQRMARWRSRRLRDRARAALDGGRFEIAIEALDSADSLWFGKLRDQELRLEAHIGAAEERAERLAGEEHDIELRLALAEDFLEIGEPRKVLELLELADQHIESLDANNLTWKASLALLRGRSLCAMGKSEDALEHLELAQELWPVDVEPLYYLAVAQLRAGRRTAGRRSLVSASAMDGELSQLRLREYREAVVG